MFTRDSRITLLILVVVLAEHIFLVLHGSTHQGIGLEGVGCGTRKIIVMFFMFV